MNETGAGRSTTIGEIVLSYARAITRFSSSSFSSSVVFLNEIREIRFWEGEDESRRKVEGLIENPSVNRLRAWNETKPWMMGIENGETRISFFLFCVQSNGGSEEDRDKVEVEMHKESISTDDRDRG